MIFIPQLLIYVFSQFMLPPEQVTFLVNGRITYTNQYCGGAPPSEEMLKELSIPKIFPGKVLFIRKGSENYWKKPILTCVETDSNGKFKIRLKKGIYSVVSENKKDKRIYQQYLKVYGQESKNYSAVNIDCLQNWMKTPDFSFEVKDTTITIAYNYALPCPWNVIPCIQYKGPLPP